MPELPEVETIRRQLAPHLEGRPAGAHGGPRRALVRARGPGRGGGRRVRAGGSSGSARRGKYLVLELEDEVFLVMHLRMTGNLLLGERRGGAALRARPVRSSTRASGCCSPTCAASAPAWCCSARTPATTTSPPGSAWSRCGEDFTADALRALARGRRAPVKAFLLSQERIAGRGQHLRRRGALPRPHPPAAAGRDAAAARSSRRCARRWSRRSRRASTRAAPRSTTSATWTAPRARSRTASWPTAARASPAYAAARRSGRSGRRGRGTYFCPRCQRRPRVARQA